MTEKILVIQTAFIGDAILTLPMIRFLKDSFPSSQIDIIAIPSTKEIFSSSPFVDNVIVLDKRGEHKPLKNFLSFCSSIKKMRYTRLYSPHRSFRSSIMALLSGVKETYGFDKNSIKYVYKNIVKYKSSHHEVQRNLTLAGLENLDNNWKILPEVVIPGEAKTKTDQLLTQINHPGKFIAVAPGSVWNTKKYPKEYYNEIIRYLVKKNYFVLLLGGIEDASVCNEMAAEAEKNVLSAAGKYSLIESIDIIKKCSLLISNDSAPTHMGMCADVPVITIYCSTIADFGFYPYNAVSSYLSYNDLYCKPCGIHGYKECPVKNFACGYNLKPEVVIKEIEGILNGN
ncbi:MAG: glycosyltransferase family 9 protein [Ignavibacteriaceae bacterium]